ncbi:MAG: N-acetylmuramoyl-L-alanine amidase [Peptostreptococcaceae bacterium]|nr:N-acetylmuramoyl-L-alanine amidase [Peptostreptococcaceae bacterium]
MNERILKEKPIEQVMDGQLMFEQNLNEQQVQITKIIDFASGNGAQGEGTHPARHTELVKKTMLSKFNHSSRRGSKIKYLVIHDTGNRRKGADAIAHAKYFGRANRNASAHYFVDDHNIVQIVADEQASWHCGDGRGRNGITNENSIGIEMCINSDGDYDLAFVNTAVLIAKLMDKHKIPISRVVRHYDASGKICPQSMYAHNWQEWEELKSLVEMYH